MPASDPRIDAYIAAAAPFAQPILARLRARVHEACPEVEETIKWGSPFFVYRGLLCHMAAFKQHCAFGFWKGKQIVGEDAPEEAMGQFGRLGALADLPPKKVFVAYLKKAMALNEAGVPTATRAKKTPRPETAVPDDLAAALAGNAKARGTFEAFSPSQRREYVEWIAEARRAETRAQRLATTLEWLAEGKPRNWKYTR
ncbi:YdeI/OmpD-associated family protein [Dokdonella sp.]|uniref:YdeI/OmpD-associated family protein n=1 Tax=Dokdonella sp. TaxID=2291710 RepID=UPI002628D113|nr:YdeI/OmpD-associated family protein [Dokdonella sp.]